MSKSININVLSEKSINEARKQLEAYIEDVKQKTVTLAQRLAQEGVIVAEMQIMSFPAIDTGDLLNSINMKPGTIITNGAIFYVYTDCPYAAFVEFGTGVVGESNPHPNPQAVQGYGSYDSQGHGDSGWFYPDDGEWHWTKGMPSRPFMYNTSLELAKKVSSIAREVFGYGR